MVAPVVSAHAVTLLASASLALFGLVGCASPQRQAPGEPPTPESISKDDPGGDADDPVRAALERLLAEDIHSRADKFNTLKVPLPDHEHWRRVKIWGYPTRATFRYGDDHHALSVVWYTEAPSGGSEDSVGACYDAFLAFAEEVAHGYKADYDLSPLEVRERELAGEASQMLVRKVEGHVSAAFVSDDYVGSFAVYPSWPGTCLVHGFAVVATDHPELAREVRDRWLDEAADKLRWKSTTQPALEDR